MNSTIRVMQIGLGYIGLAVAQIVAERREYSLVAAADINPELAGKNLDQLAGGPKGVKITVSSSLKDAIAYSDVDVAILTTSSTMKDITPQVLELVEAGIPVVSTCEELVYPWRTDHALAEKINTASTDAGVAVLSTGVNPGFLMDFLPTVVSRIARRVDRVIVDRVQDAGTRREAFQRKVGAGLTVEEFESRVAAGNFGHAGLEASVDLLASGLGWELDNVTESIEPVIADQPHQTEFVAIRPGQVTGVYQVGRGFKNGTEVITLTFRAAVGEPESFDRVRLEGIPDLESVFPSGVPGDVATGAITAGVIPLVLKLKPGLHTMADLWPSG
ncbi:dihydrodipicolinate reductase [Candidatus Neomarinimicrobiota bacterium]